MLFEILEDWLCKSYIGKFQYYFYDHCQLVISDAGIKWLYCRLLPVGFGLQPVAITMETTARAEKLPPKRNYCLSIYCINIPTILPDVGRYIRNVFDKNFSS